MTPAAGTTPAPDVEPTFNDQEGKAVSIGDHIAVTKDGEEQHGVVTDIDNTDHRMPGGEVRVDFADGVDDYEYYPLQPRRRTPMRKRLSIASSTSPKIRTAYSRSTSRLGCIMRLANSPSVVNNNKPADIRLV